MPLSSIYLICALLLLLMMVGWLRKKIGRFTGNLRVRHFAFPSAWLKILEENVSIYQRLPVDLRDRLQDRIIQFMDGKRWKHCGGLEAVTDEMKVTIAGQACFLLLNRDHAQNFAKVLTIMIYPQASLGGGDAESALPPEEAWPSASVLLAWDEVKKNARDLRDECNGVVPEWARRLTLKEGQRNGQPVLGGQCQHTAWARVMSREFFRCHGDQIGFLTPELPAGDPREIFAAATELFYEMPSQLQQQHPELYALLRTFYQLDPARWTHR